MTWLRLILECNRDVAEKITDLLERLGAVSVSLEAANEELIVDDFSEQHKIWDQTRITALLHEDTDLDILTGCLRNAAGTDAISSHKVEVLQDQDWVTNYQQQVGPRLFGDILCICPGWSEPPATAKHVLMMDPGLAFGTGSHPTTGLCLDWLVTQEVTDKTVIDFGCGSGILGLSALKLGAKHAWAIDIDSVALAATRKNAERNKLSGKITTALPDQIEIPRTQILMANVLLNPLIELAEKFSDLSLPGADIVLSGILATQAEQCLAVYARWFTMSQPLFSNEWAMLVGKRKI